MLKKSLIALALTATLASCSMNEQKYTADEYMDFLYQRMNLADSLDYSRDYYIENINLAMQARAEMPWGSSVPEREFRNFVLPVRVNNEHLDDSRAYFYKELAPRIKGMSMGEAVIEINHWLHEKVTYRPSDSRTSPPLSTIKTSFGRCGEESTLGVAAMRAMGIPARQVYTPRWAHTDDNHAWVEVWVDGKWYFLGACEPQPILNLAWFNAPASRGILMSTNALGGYDGDEEALSQNHLFTQINVTNNYATVDTARVTIVDNNGAPVPNAKVRFMVYNYAEFYPVATKTANDKGEASLTTGLGDIVIWATAPDGKTFAIDKYSVGKTPSMTITLDKNQDFEGCIDLTIVPPSQSANLPTPTPEQAAENDRRFAQEDSIRGAYMATFFNEETAREFVNTNGMNADDAQLLVLAYGNHATIAQFLRDAKDKALAVKFLRTLSEKDIRDITPEILKEFYTEALPKGSDDNYVKYVMNPRVYNETLTPYKSFFQEAIPESERALYQANPAQWVEWIKSNIHVAESNYPKTIHISPKMVYTHRRDITPVSRDIFAVASFRSMGVPAYFDAVTKRPHYFDTKTGKDIEIVWSTQDSDQEIIPKGKLTLSYKQVGRIDDPGYYTHFSLSTIKDGVPSLLDFDDYASWKQTFAGGVSIDAGQTLLVSGQRLANGAVLARAEIFNIKENSNCRRPLTIRQDTSSVQVVGSFNSENIYHDLSAGINKSILSTTGRGYYCIGLIRPDHEPSIHILNDLSADAKAIEEWGGKILLLFQDAAQAAKFKKSDFPKLPSNVVFGVDVDNVIANEMAQFGTDLPVVLIADTFNRVVFISEGYTINLGRSLLDTFSKL